MAAETDVMGHINFQVVIDQNKFDENHQNPII